MVGAIGTGNTEILSAFFYGRALAATLNKRLSEIAVDAISEISKAIAERPTRLKDFQVGWDKAWTSLHSLNSAHARACPIR